MLKKILCLLIVLCMAMPVAAFGERLTLTALFPVISEVQRLNYAEGSDLLIELWSLYEEGEAYWYVWKVSVDNEPPLHECYFELNYDDGEFISVAVVYGDKEPMITIFNNGEKPSEDLITNYFNKGFIAEEVEDKDLQNYYIHLTNVVK